jgi:hypothetical protein
MPKKKKEETISDIIDRIEEDLEAIREKAEEDTSFDDDEEFEEDEDDQ